MRRSAEGVSEVVGVRAVVVAVVVRALALDQQTDEVQVELADDLLLGIGLVEPEEDLQVLGASGGACLAAI